MPVVVLLVVLLIKIRTLGIKLVQLVLLGRLLEETRGIKLILLGDSAGNALGYLGRLLIQFMLVLLILEIMVKLILLPGFRW